ncbi:hypothetical protein EVAR_4753_1 [Eumeta japonica]|uniref:Uncharacterized protein n=1 Tax=Eumeta variegata TaxID=151549 RepID=A0A4C1SYU0_EUMVA|nr:hypothetical protein EVAR_4753_1 [Eumeta japonica]
MAAHTPCGRGGLLPASHKNLIKIRLRTRAAVARFRLGVYQIHLYTKRYVAITLPYQTVCQVNCSESVLLSTDYSAGRHLYSKCTTRSNHFCSARNPRTRGSRVGDAGRAAAADAPNYNVCRCRRPRSSRSIEASVRPPPALQPDKLVPELIFDRFPSASEIFYERAQRARRSLCDDGFIFLRLHDPRETGLYLIYLLVPHRGGICTEST